MSKLDNLRTTLLSLVSVSNEADLSTLDLWQRYLESIGRSGTVLKMAAEEAALDGVTVEQYLQGDTLSAVEELGPELAPALSGGTGWTAAGTGAAYTGGQAVFTASSSTAIVEATGITGLNDNTQYKIVITVTGYTQGKARVQVTGDTANHLGQTTDGGIAANGTFTFYVVTDQTTAVAINRIRIQTNGPSTPGNTLTVTDISVKEVL